VRDDPLHVPDDLDQDGLADHHARKLEAINLGC